MALGRLDRADGVGSSHQPGLGTSSDHWTWTSGLEFLQMLPGVTVGDQKSSLAFHLRASTPSEQELHQLGGQRLGHSYGLVPAMHLTPSPVQTPPQIDPATSLDITFYLCSSSGMVLLSLCRAVHQEQPHEATGWGG